MQRTSAPVPICAGGDKLRNPFQELLVTFGVVKNIYSEGFQEVTPYASCTIIESVFAYWDTTQDDSFCYWNQLVRGQICGCPDNSEIKALVWTQRCSRILSLSGSLLISMSIIKKPRNVRWSSYNQIVLSVSFFDSLRSIAYIRLHVAFKLGYSNLASHPSTIASFCESFSYLLSSTIGQRGNSAKLPSMFI